MKSWPEEETRAAEPDDIPALPVTPADDDIDLNDEDTDTVDEHPVATERHPHATVSIATNECGSVRRQCWRRRAGSRSPLAGRS